MAAEPRFEMVTLCAADLDPTAVLKVNVGVAAKLSLRTTLSL